MPRRRQVETPCGVDARTHRATRAARPRQPVHRAATGLRHRINADGDGEEKKREGNDSLLIEQHNRPTPAMRPISTQRSRVSNVRAPCGDTCRGVIRSDVDISLSRTGRTGLGRARRSIRSVPSAGTRAIVSDRARGWRAKGVQTNLHAMHGRSVSYLVTASFALVAALASPATMVVHGLAHSHFVTAHDMLPGANAGGETSGEFAPARLAHDSDHPSLHGDERSSRSPRLVLLMPEDAFPLGAPPPGPGGVSPARAVPPPAARFAIPEQSRAPPRD